MVCDFSNFSIPLSNSIFLRQTYAKILLPDTCRFAIAVSDWLRPHVDDDGKRTGFIWRGHHDGRSAADDG